VERETKIGFSLVWVFWVCVLAGFQVGLPKKIQWVFWVPPLLRMSQKWWICIYL